MDSPDEQGCDVCRRYPAAHAEFFTFFSIVIFFGFHRTAGRHCRDCGLATYRINMSATFFAIWWGIGIVFLPAAVILNWIGRRHVITLPQPQRRDAQAITVFLDPGRPMWQRPAALVAIAVPIGLLVLLNVAGMQLDEVILAALFLTAVATAVTVAGLGIRSAHRKWGTRAVVIIVTLGLVSFCAAAIALK